MFYSAKAFRQDLCWDSLNNTQLGQILEGSHGNVKLMMDTNCVPSQIKIEENQSYFHVLWIMACFVALFALAVMYQLMHWLFLSTPCPKETLHRTTRAIRPPRRRVRPFVQQQDEEEILFGDEDLCHVGNCSNDDAKDEEVMFEDEEQEPKGGVGGDDSRAGAQRTSQLFPLHAFTFSNGGSTSPEMSCLESNVSALSILVAEKRRSNNHVQNIYETSCVMA